MEVYNKEKTQVLTSYDIEKGRIVSDTIDIIIPEIKAVEKQSHYEVVAEYPNGGKDVKEVVDVEPVEYVPAHTEKKEIQVYIPYTESELASFEINKLKQWFNDYYTIHEQKYRRLNTLGLKTDDGVEPLDELKKLYTEAEEKRKKIQELEEN